MKEGTKMDNGKPDWSLLPLDAVEPIVRVLTKGAVKYSPGNWKLVANARDRYYSALLRHLKSYQSGEALDSDFNEHHLAHIGCCVIFLLWFEVVQKSVAPIPPSAVYCTNCGQLRGEREWCQHCGHTGRRAGSEPKKQALAPGSCSECLGLGWVVREVPGKVPCDKCSGTGRSRLDLQMPEGWSDPRQEPQEGDGRTFGERYAEFEGAIPLGPNAAEETTSAGNAKHITLHNRYHELRHAVLGVGIADASTEEEAHKQTMEHVVLERGRLDDALKQRDEAVARVTALEQELERSRTSHRESVARESVAIEERRAAVASAIKMDQELAAARAVVKMYKTRDEVLEAGVKKLVVESTEGHPEAHDPRDRVPQGVVLTSDLRELLDSREEIAEKPEESVGGHPEQAVGQKCPKCSCDGTFFAIGTRDRIGQVSRRCCACGYTFEWYVRSSVPGTLAAQVHRLSRFIQENIPGEPSQDQGAVDTAIRLLGDNAARARVAEEMRKARDESVSESRVAWERVARLVGCSAEAAAPAQVANLLEEKIESLNLALANQEYMGKPASSWHDKAMVYGAMARRFRVGLEEIIEAGSKAMDRDRAHRVLEEVIKVSCNAIGKLHSGESNPGVPMGELKDIERLCKLDDLYLELSSHLLALSLPAHWLRVLKENVHIVHTFGRQEELAEKLALATLPGPPANQ